MLNYDVVVQNEPKIVTEIRHKILDTFKDLSFVEEGHHYYLNGKEIPSVSSVIHQFEPEKISMKLQKTMQLNTVKQKNIG